MNLFEEEPAPVKGGLSFLNKFNNQLNTSSRGNDRDTMKEIWANRGGYEFTMRPSTKAQIVFLGDLQPLAATPFLLTWINKSGKSFPKIEYVRSGAFDLQGDPTGEQCLMSSVTTLSPKTAAVAPILDFRSYETKDGKTVPYSFRHVFITSPTILNQLISTSQHYGKPLTFAKMEVSRSGERTSPKCGDTWFPKGFVTEAELDQYAPEWREEVKKFNFDKGWPAPDLAMAKDLLGSHVRQVDANKDKTHFILQYDADAWAAMSGGPAPQAEAPSVSDSAPAPVAKSPFDDLEDLPNTPAPAAEAPLATSQFDLSELDDVLG